MANINKIELLIMLAFLIKSAYCGFFNSPLAYSDAFSAPSYLPYDAPLPPPPAEHQFLAPLPVEAALGPSQALPVAPITVNSYEETTHHSYAAPSSVAAPVAPVFKYHSGFTPLRTYSALQPRVRFAASSRLPSLYSGLLPYGLSSPTLGYSRSSGPSAVVKFGPPITTTTTTYSSAASGTVTPVASPFVARFAGRIGW